MKKPFDKSKNMVLPFMLLSLLLIFISAFYPSKIDHTHTNTSIGETIEVAKTNVMCEITCPANVSILCNQDPDFRDDSGQLMTGEATLDNCELGVSVTYEDSIVYLEPCATPQMEIHRKWLALDGDSNIQNNCTQIISVGQWSPKKLEFPETAIIYDLTDCANFQDQAHTANPSITGEPSLNGLPIFNDNTPCRINVTYSDEYFFMCPDSIEVIRSWKVQNLCHPKSSVNPIVHNQTIKILSKSGPLMITCPEDIIMTVDPWACTASGELPIPSNIQDLCGGTEFNAEILEGGTLLISGSAENGDLSVQALDLAPGIHHIQYTISDSCDNIFDCEFVVTVPDRSPIILLNPDIVIELTSTSTSGDATATMYYDELDNGSHDPCGLIKLEIRRDVDLCDIPGNATYNDDGHAYDGDSDPDSPNYDPDGGEFVKFCCADLYNTLYDVDGDGIKDYGYIKVWLRVWSDNNNDNIFGNNGDVYHEVWTFVKVVDKLTPAIACPPDITVQCIDDFNNPDVTGWAEGFSICGSAPTEFTDIIINLNSCDIGFIRKRWNVIGRADIFCDQTVTIIGEDIPLDVVTEQSISYDYCPDTTEIPLPIVPTSSCDVIGYTFTADTTYFNEGACYQVIRDYFVVNWCIYEPNNPDWEETADFSDGLARITQTINVTDEVKPTIQECNDLLLAVNDHEDEDNDGIQCEAKLILTNSAIDPNGEFCLPHGLKWVVTVDLFADGVDDLEYNSFLPPFDDVFNDTNGNGIPDIYLKPTISGEEVSIQLPDIEGDLSNHKVYWKVVDVCNNVHTCDYDFLVVDQTPPTPICQDSSSVDLPPIGSTTIWAIDYILEATDYCTSTENLRYTFSELPPDDDPLYDPILRSSSRIVTLDDIGNSPFELAIFTWDERDNFAICMTLLDINTAPLTQKETTTGITQNQQVDPATNESLDANAYDKVYINSLHQNHPNPFRYGTEIQFDLAQDEKVKLIFMNATNARIQEIEIDGKRGLNTYSLSRDLLFGQGLYYYRLIAKNYKETKKMILLN